MPCQGEGCRSQPIEDTPFLRPRLGVVSQVHTKLNYTSFFIRNMAEILQIYVLNKIKKQLTKRSRLSRFYCSYKKITSVVGT